MTAQNLDILVCDDESALREALRRSFEREGHRVLAVPEGHLAVERASSQHFDIVLLDVALPAAPRPPPPPPEFESFSPRRPPASTTSPSSCSPRSTARPTRCSASRP